MKYKYLLMVYLIFSTGCTDPGNPLPQKTSTSSSLVYPWITTLNSTDAWTGGKWNWAFTFGDSLSGSATLELQPLEGTERGWDVCWQFQPALPELTPDTRLTLTPVNEDRWHNIHWSNSNTTAPIPLPRQQVNSSHYANLLELLKELTTPFFNQIVTHWPDYPIPIRLVEATNGPIDLAACLTEAAEIWNQNELTPWFEVDSSASWGIRLVHFPDREMHPPLAAQITRLDSIGRPLRVHLLAGNNYNRILARPYVVRGFVHELGHALFLWGHSTDRIHCLWGLAPPLVSEPSEDERKAARLWHGLPDGLDLSQYDNLPGELSSP